ncbi:XK-related protein 8-like [Cyprinus carpio]|uniref:XK-related protein n=1 Tax=Cyprinus carpio TaxID=7962 RepID=A0A9R0BGE3_CYPCA|nr:XK-related protein 8-like [Cyprinus carpio]
MVETQECFPLGCLLKYLFTLVGLILFLVDIVLDIWTVVSFYQDGAYVYMAVMIFLLLGSSVLLQVFSWLWYSDSLDKIETKVEKFTDRHSLIKPFHFLQLGVYLRFASQFSVFFSILLQFIPNTDSFNSTTTVFCSEPRHQHGCNYIPHSHIHLILFNYIQCFSVSGLKILTSAAGIALSVALYHRSMRIYLPEKRKMSWISTGVYFLWNLLLIIPRVTALALFCSVLPCYIIAHFLSLWMLLVLVAWSQKTDHMKSPGWEWLFRVAVGLIWYFSWFNVSKKGSIKVKMVLYYIFMALDTMLLLGLWCWKVFEYAGCLHPFIVIPTLLGLYIIGILVKIIYYRWFHPKITDPREGQIKQAATYNTDLTDSTVSSLEDIAAAPVQPLTGALKRSRTMADNFYF